MKKYPIYIGKHRRYYLFCILCISVLSLVIFLIFFALEKQISFFRVPSEITTEDRLSGNSLRLGGYVEKNSLYFKESTHIFFRVTDFKRSETVFFNGILPDLFREEQGVIVEGKFKDGLFIASRVLAKHNEKYIPKKTR